MKKLFLQSIKNIYHLFQAALANFIYGFPSRKIKVIGVTGTNGKTTTVQMIAKILEESGFKVAVNSTINFKVGEKEWINKTKFTTLSSFKIQKFISDAVKEECDYLVLETSSHALDQNRVWGIDYEVAVITNVTREHLDYHGDMRKYRDAKKILFSQLTRSLKKTIRSSGHRVINKVAVVNLDMEEPEYYLNCSAKEKYGYSVIISKSQIPISNKIPNPNDQIKKIIAENIELGINHSSYKLQATSYKLNLPGLFNIENALAATCVGLSQNINLETIKSALEKIKLIPGRMEYVPNKKGLNIIVDYAVTPDSLEKLYELILKFKEVGLPSRSPTSKIISVFGACGERDRGKRPIMGEIVSRFADYIILTNEDPYNEDPKQIIDELFSGVVNPNSQIPISNKIPNFKSQNSKFEERENCWRIMDRRAAIKRALQIARPGDYIIVTGKGAEETMAIGNERIEWNDKKVILEELDKI